MKLRYKFALGSLLIVAILLSSLAVVLSHDAACGAAPAPAVEAGRMNAVVYRCYGPPDVLALEQVGKPAPKDDEILVKVRAAAINPLDWHYMRGEPYVMRLDTGLGTPKFNRLGVDFAGTVEAVGAKVTQFKPGDEVFGGRSGALADYVTVRESGAVVAKPPALGFAEAAAVPIAALTALQGLRDAGKLQPGQKVLINGASGGVGTFAVQIAKSYGADVTGVCSTRNVELVRSLGADEIVDYTREDFTESALRYDIVLDNVGNRALLDVRQVLKPEGRYVLIGGGGPDAGPWIGPLVGPVKAMVLNWFVSQDMGMFLAGLNKQDLGILGELMASGKVRPVIDRQYEMAEIRDAMAYLETGRARGKVVIRLEP